VWDGGAYGEDETLASCYRRCLAVADELGARSIAFPAIATGVYGFPADRAARIAVATVRATPTKVEHIRFVAFDSETYSLLNSVASAWSS
jgi:O-acetyl-ADP-ribose deacetylase (regulator of RNase III)